MRERKICNLQHRECPICLQPVGYDIYGAVEYLNNTNRSIDNIDLNSSQMQAFKFSNFMRTPCNHAFHQKCLVDWMDSRNFSCPLCRMSLPQFHSQ